ncbi:MAG: flagellar regulator YcgR PilZN domain-containing protein [Rhodanobacteraceae bacterium]
MLKDPDVIRVLLTRLIAARCPVFVFVEGDDERYATTLLELDADANALIADELNPRRGNANVRRGAKLRVAARLEGVDMRFSTRVRAIDADADVSAYMLELPPELDHREQRSVHRTRAFAVAAELRDQDGPPVEGRVLDVSISGLRIAVKKPHRVREETRWDCTVVLPDGEFESRIAVMRVLGAQRARAGAGVEDVLGAKFDSLGEGAARRLGRYIADTQRALLRARRATTENRVP